MWGIKMILSTIILNILIGCGNFSKVEANGYYKLKKIEKKAFKDYVYFEFIYENQTYKVLSSRLDDKKVKSMCKLRKNHLYKIQLERIYELTMKNNSIETLDIEKIRFYGKNNIFVGGYNHPVYRSIELIGTYIDCSKSKRNE